MAGSEQGTRRVRHGWPVAAAMGVVIAAAGVGLAGSVLAAPRVLSAASRAGISKARPAAGVPVPYRDAQLSVPGSWLVQTPQQVSCGFPQSHGMIFAGTRPGIPKGTGCGLTSSLAWIIPAGPIPAGIRHRKPSAVIHGFRVYRLHSGARSVVYLVPQLKVRIGARGPQARRVLATLTRSPLSVVLRHGRPGKAPTNWASRRFGGIRFEAPRSWALVHQHQWATCGTGLSPRTLLLINATRPPLALPCPFQPPTATDDEAQPGLVVVTGKYAARSVDEKYGRCRMRHGIRICLSTITGQGGLASGVLIFSVSRRHQHPATFVLLGLAGSGVSARAMFDSVRPARR